MSLMVRLVKALEQSSKVPVAQEAGPAPLEETNVDDDEVRSTASTIFGMYLFDAPETIRLLHSSIPTTGEVVLAAAAVVIWMSMRDLVMWVGSLYVLMRIYSTLHEISLMVVEFWGKLIGVNKESVNSGR